MILLQLLSLDSTRTRPNLLIIGDSSLQNFLPHPTKHKEVNNYRHQEYNLEQRKVSKVIWKLISLCKMCQRVITEVRDVAKNRIQYKRNDVIGKASLHLQLFATIVGGKCSLL